jgi:serine/threonine-protein kinase
MKFPFPLPSRYSIGYKTASGQQGSVLICDDAALKRKVAIKFIQLHSINQQLEDEIAIQASVRSRHVAEVYDVRYSRHRRNIAIIQEFVSGNELRSLKKGEVEKHFLSLFWQVCSGITDIHATGAVHRDIKPANIKVDTERVAKILDFGFSTLPGVEETIRGRGSHPYRAPELYELPGKFSQAVDIYATGVLAWFLLGGDVFPAAIQQIPPGSLSQMPSFSQFGWLPQDVVVSLDACICVEPSRRPTAAHLAHTFARHILKNKHRAEIVYGNSTRVIDSSTPNLIVGLGPNSIDIFYDGFDFKVKNVTGEVYVNNRPVVQDSILPQSAVLGFGKISERIFAPINCSRPGIVI